MWTLWFISCSIILAKSQLMVDIIVSSFTDSSLASNLMILLQQNFQGQFSFNLVSIESIWDIEKLLVHPDIIFDMTFSLSLSKSLAQLAEEKHIILIETTTPVDVYSNWEFFTHNSWENQIQALSSVLSYLNWTTFLVISDEIYNQDNYFLQKECQWFYFSNSNNKTSADLFIGKQIQPTGIRNIVILNKGESTKILLQSLEEHDLLTNGTGVVVGNEGSWNLYGNGVISYTESGLENADNYYSYESLALIKFLNLVLECPLAPDPLDLVEFLNKNTVGHHPISNFTLLNIKNSEKIIAGNIFNGNLAILDSLNFPGNSSIAPNSPTTDINIWIADGTTNPGANPDLLATTVTYAEFYALSIWKSMHALDGFEITVTDTDCGVTIYDPDYAYSCFSKLLKTPGVGYLTSLYWWMAIGYIYTLRSLNCSIPHISPYTSSSITENYTTFPEFMTVIKSDTFNTQVILNLAVVFGWKDFMVIYDDAGSAMFNYFAAQLKKFNMRIVNPPELQKIDTYYTRDDYPKWKYWFKGIIKFRARIVVGFLTPPYWMYIVESFYDAGIRKGDAMFLANARLTYALAWENDEVQRRKLIDLLYGAVVIAQAEWIGDYGQMLRDGYIKAYMSDTDFRCLCFDSAMLLLHGIEFTIQKGQNVKDYQVINANLRKQKFIGCSGTISIESGGNQRSLPTIGIHSIKWDQSSGKLYEELVGEYDPSVAQLFTFYKAIMWYDNTTNVPSAIIGYENGCPFRARMISRSEKGSGVLYGISAALIVISIIESFIMWKKLWSYLSISKLMISSLVQFEDYILMAIIAIEFFQFISQGPDISGWNKWLALLCTYSLVNFDYTVKGDIYWAYLYTAMGICFYLIFIAILLLYKMNNCLRIMLQHIKNLSLLLLPLITNIAFLPIVSVLLSIFQCDQGISSYLTDSFIRQDCNTYCWDNKYILWGILSISSLVVYIPLSLYFKHYFENINENTNIKTKPLFIIEKTIFQLIIVALNKTIRIYDESLHGLCCIILFVILIGLCYKQMPYNYHRMNLWLIISYLAILSSFMLSTIYWIVNFDSIILWLALQYSTFCIFIAIGIAIQCKWCPSLLYTEKTVDIAILFKFSLGNKIAATELNKMKSTLIENKNESNIKDSIIDTKSIIYTTKAIMISKEFKN